jgi:hypothetical protein
MVIVLFGYQFACLIRYVLDGKLNVSKIGKINLISVTNKSENEKNVKIGVQQVQKEQNIGEVDEETVDNADVQKLPTQRYFELLLFDSLFYASSVSDNC